jgi:hypothetical protein
MEVKNMKTHRRNCSPVLVLLLTALVFSFAASRIDAVEVLQPEGTSAQSLGADSEDVAPVEGGGTDAAAVDDAAREASSGESVRKLDAATADAVIAALRKSGLINLKGSLVILAYDREKGPEEDLLEFRFMRVVGKRFVLVGEGRVKPLTLEIVHAWPIPRESEDKPALEEIRSFKAKFTDIDPKDLTPEMVSQLGPSQSTLAVYTLWQGLAECGWLSKKRDCQYISLDHRPGAEEATFLVESVFASDRTSPLLAPGVTPLVVPLYDGWISLKSLEVKYEHIKWI